MSIIYLFNGLNVSNISIPEIDGIDNYVFVIQLLVEYFNLNI